MPPDPLPEQLRRAREQLVSELSLQGVTEPTVLAAIAKVPRESFLPPRARPDAYRNRALPIGFGQTCSQPLIVGLTAQWLRLRPGARVLEVGAGSGYLAAVLVACGAGSVLALELVPELARSARANLDRTGVKGVEVRVGDGYEGAPERAPFDGIVVSACAQMIPPALPEQLAPGARLLCPVGNGGQRLLGLTRDTDACTSHDLGPVRFVPMRRDVAKRVLGG